MLEVMLVSSLEKVGLEENPVPLGEGAILKVLYGETVSFQIACRAAGTGASEPGNSGGQGNKLQVHASVTKQGEGADGSQERGSCGENGPETDIPELRIRQVLPVMCRRSCNPDSVDEDYLFYDARMAPDLLRDVEGEVALGEGWQSLWVDLTPGEATAPGKYRLEFCLSLEGEEPVAREVEVCVLDRRLPALSIPHTEWFHYDGIVDYYGVEAFSEEFWRIFREFLKVYVKRQGNTILTPVVTPALDTEVGGERTTIQLVGVERAEGEYRLDFTCLDRFLDICLECGIQYFEICHLFTQWGADAAPKVVAQVQGEERRIFGWDTPSDDPEYLRFLEVLLPALRTHMEDRGLLGRPFFHISEEPNLNSSGYQKAQEHVRSLLKGCTIIEAVSDYAYYEKGLVDIPVCAVDHIEPFLAGHTPRLWSYYCCAQTKEVPNRFISMPSWRNRVYGILMYWHGIDGFLHWGYNFYNSAFSKKKINPYETPDADGTFPAGDPFLVYPGREGVPEESIRLMVQDEAVNDFRALCLLESFLGRERVMELIRQEAGMELSFKTYPRNGEFILGLREKVNSLLEEQERGTRWRG